MKLKLLALAPLAALLTAPAFGQVWTNNLSDNDFANFGNWIDNTSNNPTSWGGDSTNTWIIDLAGPDRAILGATTVTGLDRNLTIGGSPNSTGAMEINGGTLEINRNLRVGQEDGSTASVNMTGGTLNIGRSAYIGQGSDTGGAVGTFDLSAGIVTVNTSNRTASQEDFGVAHQQNATGILNISGSGAFNLNIGDAKIANGSNANATINISDSGSLTIGRNARVAYGDNSTATVNISGGALNASTGFIGLGQGAGAEVTVDMSGGEINTDRMGFANNATATATLNMTGGTINLLRTTGTASHAGGLRMQSAGAALNIGGDAVINAQKLYINDGGLITLSGNALINISGSDDGANFTFDFLLGSVPEQVGGGWDKVLGQIEFASLGASIIVAGSGETIGDNTVSFLDLFNEAIVNDVFLTSTSFDFEAGYDAGGNFTYVTIIPEPSIYALIFGAGTLLLVIRRRNKEAAS